MKEGLTSPGEYAWGHFWGKKHHVSTLSPPEGGSGGRMSDGARSGMKEGMTSLWEHVRANVAYVDVLMETCVGASAARNAPSAHYLHRADVPYADIPMGACVGAFLGKKHHIITLSP